jgi:sugar transferase (PEP-CTERM/EpsH1 system associated)
MNILFLSTEVPYPPNHGHYIRTYNILKYLAQRYDVHFLGFIKKQEKIEMEPINKICKSTKVFDIPDSVSRPRLILSLFRNLFSRYPYIAQKYYSVNMEKEIRRIIENDKIDIIHYDMLHLARYRDCVGNIPSVLTEHNVESERVYRLAKNSHNIVFKLFMYLQYIKLRNFEKKAISEFDLCITVSANDMQTLSEMSPDVHFEEIPNGVDTSFYTPDSEVSFNKSLVWAGGMKDFYNQQAVLFLLESIYPIIKAYMPGIRMTLVGKCNSERILSLAKRNSVHMTGYVEDVRPFINSASVFVAPILSGGGTKLKVLNAMAMAKPVVTTSVGAEGIEAQNGVHLIIADDPAEFAEKTVYLLKNPGIARKIGENARSLILEKYDWKVIGPKMIKIYEETISDKH